MGRLTPVQSANPMVIGIRPLFSLILGTPMDNIWAVKAAIMVASRARTTTAIGRTDVRATQTGAKSGRVKPTRTTPTINLIPKTDCSINCTMVALFLCPTDHNKNCSIPTLASWSDNVENASAAWHEVVEEVMLRFMKSIMAHRAAKSKNDVRTSLRPS